MVRHSRLLRHLLRRGLRHGHARRLVRSSAAAATATEARGRGTRGRGGALGARADLVGPVEAALACIVPVISRCQQMHAKPEEICSSPFRSIIARAPKLMRRANGLGGGPLPPAGELSPLSSMALSFAVLKPGLSAVPLVAPELAVLPRRPRYDGKGEAWVGEEPLRPMVETDMRRRWWACAAAVMGPG